MTERLTAVEWGPRGDWEQWQRAVLRRARRVTVGLRALLGAAVVGSGVLLAASWGPLTIGVFLWVLGGGAALVNPVRAAVAATMERDDLRPLAWTIEQMTGADITKRGALQLLLGGRLHVGENIVTTDGDDIVTISTELYDDDHPRFDWGVILSNGGPPG